MKRDDFGMRIDEIRELATKYSKPDLARMVKMGLIDPQRALMAGMMIDRIAKSAMQPPQTTVAEDVLAAPTTAQGQIPQGVMGAPGAPEPSAGVAGLPSGLQNMAGGGIVAFADGDLVSASDTMRRGLASQQAPMAAESGLPTLPGGLRFKEYDAMAAPTLESEFETSRRAEQMAGVDTEGLFAKLQEEPAARREELKARREEAKGESLMMIGLGLMGARRGQEFEVLSNVGRQGLMQYGSALKEIRDAERDIKKTERELMLAKDKYKRDQSTANANRLAAKQEKYEDRRIRSVDQYNKGIEDITRLNMEVFKLERKEASDMALAQVQAKTSRDVAEIHERGAMARASMPDSQQKIIDKVFADLKKTNPNATYADAVQAVKSGASSSAGVLADKAYDNVMKRMETDFKLAAEVRKDPTALDRAIEAETRRLQTGGAGQTSRPPTTFNLSPEAKKALQQYGGQ
jgi:hypothetical protein